MVNRRFQRYGVLGGLVIGTILVANCASVQPREPPPASPVGGAAPSVQPRPLALSIPMVSVAAQRTAEPDDAVATTSLKSLDGAGPLSLFPERRASEGLDRLAGLVFVRHERRADVITLPSDRLVEPGQWAITSTGQFTLGELVSGLRDQDGHAIVIRAYTDSQGTAAVNDALSLRRAEAVRDFLATKGVAAESMQAEGLGARRPVAGNSTADGRAQNRRIEIVIAR
jgi:outer membrane protein OmpA-like peptidoglycan-associated protein